jgi:hypothetical protein
MGEVHNRSAGSCRADWTPGGATPPVLAFARHGLSAAASMRPPPRTPVTPLFCCRVREALDVHPPAEEPPFAADRLPAFKAHRLARVVQRPGQVGRGSVELAGRALDRRDAVAGAGVEYGHGCLLFRQAGREDVTVRRDRGRLPQPGAAEIALQQFPTVTTNAACLMSAHVEPYLATSSRRAFAASAASPCTVNERWMLRAPNPTTTRTSRTPGLRSRSDTVPRLDRAGAHAEAL